MTKIHDNMRKRGYIQASDAARRLGVSRSTLLRWEKAGCLTSERVGTRVWLSIADLKREVGPVAGAALDLEGT